MKVTTELLLKQSPWITTDMRFAIGILAMTTPDIEELITEELKKNPFLQENEAYEHFPCMLRQNNQTAYDHALAHAFLTHDFRDLLMRQIKEGPFNAMELDIAYAIIHNLDDDGFLADSDSVFQWINAELGVFHEWIESVRLRIMDLDPIGCGAINIHESLLHQAKRKCEISHDEFWSLMAKLKENPRRKLTTLSLSKLYKDHKLSELKRLDPHPGTSSSESHVKDENIFPDIRVTTTNGHPLVSLLRKPSDRLRIKDPGYLGCSHGDGQGNFLKEHLKRASFVMRSLYFREHSLAIVASAIVKKQAGWFINGAPLQPLNLREIAQLSGLHESSISRLTRKKYLVCDRGCFELKYFFSAAIGQHDGHKAISATTIKDQIATIINREDKTSPLSDQKIVEELDRSGTSISRRTVTKYREALRIASAMERRAMLR